MRTLLLLITFAFLAACGNFKEKAGLVKYKPDEYEVPTNQPLVVPPVFTVYPLNKAPLKKQEAVDNKSLSKGENSILQNLQ